MNAPPSTKMSLQRNYPSLLNLILNRRLTLNLSSKKKLSHPFPLTALSISCTLFYFELEPRTKTKSLETMGMKALVLLMKQHGNFSKRENMKILTFLFTVFYICKENKNKNKKKIKN